MPRAPRGARDRRPAISRERGADEQRDRRRDGDGGLARAAEQPERQPARAKASTEVKPGFRWQPGERPASPGPAAGSSARPAWSRRPRLAAATLPIVPRNKRDRARKSPCHSLPGHAAGGDGDQPGPHHADACLPARPSRVPAPSDQPRTNSIMTACGGLGARPSRLSTVDARFHDERTTTGNVVDRNTSRDTPAPTLESAGWALHGPLTTAPPGPAAGCNVLRTSGERVGAERETPKAGGPTMIRCAISGSRKSAGAL